MNFSGDDYKPRQVSYQALSFYPDYKHVQWGVENCALEEFQGLRMGYICLHLKVVL